TGQAETVSAGAHGTPAFITDLTVTASGKREPPIGANTPITLSLELGAHERPFGTASVPGGTDGGVDRADARPPFVMPRCPLPALACRPGGRESGSGRSIGVLSAVSWLTTGCRAAHRSPSWLRSVSK